MGEAKRRKKSDPSFGNSLVTEVIVTQMGVMTVYGKKPDVPFTCAHLIKPGFDPSTFDHTVRHKVFDWQSYFFSSNQESEKYEEMVAKVTKPYAQKEYAILLGHLMAFKVYLQRKIDKDLVTDPEAFDMRYYLDCPVTSVTMFNASEGVKRVAAK